MPGVARVLGRPNEGLNSGKSRSEVVRCQPSRTPQQLNYVHKPPVLTCGKASATPLVELHQLQDCNQAQEGEALLPPVRLTAHQDKRLASQIAPEGERTASVVGGGIGREPAEEAPFSFDWTWRERCVGAHTWKWLEETDGQLLCFQAKCAVVNP